MAPIQFAGLKSESSNDMLAMHQEQYTSRLSKLACDISYAVSTSSGKDIR